MEVKENGNELTITFTYDAPKALVFSMFQNPHVAKWWGPTTWPVKVSEMDFRPGGKWHYCMVGPDGTEAWGLATYKEIDEPNKIVFVDNFSDADGNVDETLPEAVSTLTFNEIDSKTILTMHGQYESPEQREKVVAMGMIEGMQDTYEQLTKLLQQMQ
jgi:uncharacterized protein YndB with AHSA1/START domain